MLEDAISGTWAERHGALATQRMCQPPQVTLSSDCSAALGFDRPWLLTRRYASRRDGRSGAGARRTRDASDRTNSDPAARLRCSSIEDASPSTESWATVTVRCALRRSVRLSCGCTRGVLISRSTSGPSEPLAGLGRFASAFGLDRVSVSGLGSSGRASTAPLAWRSFRLLVSCSLQSSIVSSLAHALSRTSIPCRGSCPRRVDLAIGALGLPVQGVHPSTKRCLLVAGHCLLVVGSAPLPDFRRLPRSSASTSRLRSSRRSLDLHRCDPARASLPLLRFPPLGSPCQCPVARVHP